MKIDTFNHIKHKPIESKVSPIDLKIFKLPTCITDEEE